MQFPHHTFFYYQPPQPQGLGLSPLMQTQAEELAKELELEKEKNRALALELEKTREEKRKADQELVRMMELLERREVRVKRKYRKRRLTTDRKAIRCSFDGCPHRYSSRIALNAHIRKKHRKMAPGDPNMKK